MIIYVVVGYNAQNDETTNVTAFASYDNAADFVKRYNERKDSDKYYDALTVDELELDEEVTEREKKLQAQYAAYLTDGESAGDGEIELGSTDSE